MPYGQKRGKKSIDIYALRAKEKKSKILLNFNPGQKEKTTFKRS